jgi:hypothetical protein
MSIGSIVSFDAADPSASINAIGVSINPAGGIDQPGRMHRSSWSDASINPVRCVDKTSGMRRSTRSDASIRRVGCVDQPGPMRR